MSLLDTFILSFGTEGLTEVKKDIEETERKIDSLEKEENKLNETIKKGGKEAEKAKERLKQVQKELKDARLKLAGLENSTGGLILKFKEAAAVGAKFLGVMVAFKKAADITSDFASNALELADAAKEAGLSIEDYQNKEFGGYELFTRQDINNAKEYEMIMRDVRMGGVAITNNLARMFLPVLIKIGKVIKTVTDFFVEHGALVKSVFLIIAAIISGIVIKSILAMAPALWSALAPLLPIIAAVGLLALAFEDLIVWINGGESAFGDLWESIFGNAEGAKQFIKDLIDLWNTLWELLKPALQWIAQFVGSVILAVLEKVIKGIGWLVNKVRDLKAQADSAKDSANNKTPNGSHADGLDYVPFDGYIAELHKGERVQTADEAQDWRSGLMAAKKAVNFTASYPLNAIPSSAVSNAYNNSTSNRTINIGDITIQTQATDSQGIATDIAQYIKQAVISLDDGMLA